jgi:hypothetical protein
MPNLSNILQHSPTQPHPCDDSRVAGFNLYLNDSPSASRYLRLSVQALLEYSQDPPDVQRLTLIVEAALSAQALFFAASLHDPDPVELHRFFEMFILACVVPPEKRRTP